MPEQKWCPKCDPSICELPCAPQHDAPDILKEVPAAAEWFGRWWSEGATVREAGIAGWLQRASLASQPVHHDADILNIIAIALSDADDTYAEFCRVGANDASIFLYSARAVSAALRENGVI